MVQNIAIFATSSNVKERLYSWSFGALASHYFIAKKRPETIEGEVWRSEIFPGF